MVNRIYSKLNVDYNIVTAPSVSTEDIRQSHTEYTTTVNEREQSIIIYIDPIGRDLIGCMSEIIESHRGKYWTMQLILPVDKADAISAYSELKKLGFFFVGARPLCSTREQIFMQYTGDVYFDFSDFKLTKQFTELLDIIMEFYEGRNI